jgi:hypothetical protein
MGWHVHEPERASSRPRYLEADRRFGVGMPLRTRREYNIVDMGMLSSAPGRVSRSAASSSH